MWPPREPLVRMRPPEEQRPQGLFLTQRTVFIPRYSDASPGVGIGISVPNRRHPEVKLPSLQIVVVVHLYLRGEETLER